MRVLVIKGKSSYGVLRQFADQSVAAFEALGHQLTVFDGQRERSLDLTIRQARENFDLIFTFNGMGAEWEVSANGQTRSNFEVIDLPVVSWMVDHPAYHYVRMKAPVPRRLTLCPNQEHCGFIASAGIVGEQRILLAGALGEAVYPTPYRARKFDAVLAATWMGEAIPFWDSQCDSASVEIFERSLELLSEDVAASPWQAFNTACREKSIAISPGPQVFSLLSEMLYYVRRLDRIRTVRTLAESGLPVTIVGSGWDAYSGPRGNLRFLPDQDTAAMIEIYRESKIVFNFNAANGASERAFTGMLAGAAVVSDFGESLAQAARHGEEIVFFDRSEPEDIARKLGHLLETDDGEKIATLGREKTLREHLWSHRIETLLGFLSETDQPFTTCTEVA